MRLADCKLSVRITPLVLALSLMTNFSKAQEIVAHRGASFDAPENTMSAFELAWEQGADLIEGDFYLSRDNKIVCIHDSSTKRTGNKDISVSGSTLAELKNIEVGSWKDSRWDGEPIPTLKQVMKSVPKGKRLLIEIKCGAEIVPKLKAELEEGTLPLEQLTVIAFDAKVVAEVKKAMPQLKAFWLTSFKQDKATGAWSPSLNSVLETLAECQADGLDCQANLEVLDKEFVEQLRKGGYEFHTWTVNDLSVAKKLKDLGVDSITTDRPGWLRQGMQKDQ